MLSGVLLGLAALASATPFWQAQHTNLLPASMARNIRHLPCVSRRTGESGTCMFAFSCAKLNGTHLGTCIDRFYFGSCCKVPEDTGNDLDAVPPIEDNSLDGTTTTRIRPAVTQKPQNTPQYTTPAFSTPRPSTPGLQVQSSTEPSTTQRPTTQGISTQTFASTSGFPSSGPSFGSSTPAFSGSPPGFGSSTQGFGSSTPSFGSSQPSFGSSTPSFGSSATSFVSSTPSSGSTQPGFGSSSPSFGSSSPSFGSSPPSFGSSPPSFGSSSPSFGSSPPSFGSSSPSFGSSSPSFGSSTPTIPVSTQGSVSSTSGLSSSPGGGFGSSTPGSISTTQTALGTSGVTNKPPVSSSTPTLPSFQQPTTAPPTFVTWTTIEEATGKPPPISIRPQVSEVSGGTHRPTLVSSTERPSTERPVITSTVVLPISSVSSPRPPISTHKPTVTAKPSNATKPASTVRPVTSKPTGGTVKPAGSTPSKPTKPAAKPPPPKPQSTPRPPVTSPKPQKPPPKPAVTKPKPPSKPAKPPAKPTTPRPPPKPATTRPPTTTTTTTQASSSETWVPISVSTHEPSPTPPTTDRPGVSSSSSQSPVPSSTPSGPSSSSVALPSVMSTTTPAPIDTLGLNMSNYKDVCGRRLFPESRVVGGDKSTFGKWPWQISLRQWRTSTYLHKCGAALLNENWAITAAHCVENVPPSDLLLRLGEHDLSIEDEPFGYQERRVQIVASHPQFDPRTFEYDLALLRFYEPVVFQPNIIPICVPEDDTHFVGTTAYVTGWGRLYEDGPLPSVLQEVSVPVINNTLCETMYRAAGYIEHIPDIFICAGWKKGGFDSCEGDSGGPMVIQRPDKRWLLAGVISWGIGCAEPNQPGVYTRISQFRHWINQILQF